MSKRRRAATAPTPTSRRSERSRIGGARVGNGAFGRDVSVAAATTSRIGRAHASGRLRAHTPRGQGAESGALSVLPARPVSARRNALRFGGLGSGEALAWAFVRRPCAGPLVQMSGERSRNDRGLPGERKPGPVNANPKAGAARIRAHQENQCRKLKPPRPRARISPRFSARPTGMTRPSRARSSRAGSSPSKRTWPSSTSA